MSHHGREYEDDCDYVSEYRVAANRLSLAIEFIRAIANRHYLDNEDDRTFSSEQAAEWLDKNGYDGPLSAKRALHNKINDIDAKIKSLQDEKSKLVKSSQ